MGEKMRLDRLLSECGQGTRSEVKTYIKKGRVTVNGAAVKDNGLKVDLSDDVVMLNGRQVVYEKFRYFMLNKPQGCVSATRDGLSATVLDLLEGEITRDLFPVGRLDKDTEGFLLITNDGQLGHELLSPRRHVDKRYIARVSKPLSPEQLAEFESGVDIGDEKLTMPAKIRTIEGSTGDEGDCESEDRTDYGDEPDRPDSASASTKSGDEAGLYAEMAAAAGISAEDFQAIYEVTLQEGRYHQVKRMFEAFGSRVEYLKRISMGEVVLDDSLEPGEYRRLTEEEVEALRKG